MILWILLKPNQKTHRLANNILEKRGFNFSYLKCCGDKEHEIFQITQTYFVFHCIFLFKELEDNIPSFFINVQKILFMVGNEYRRVTFSYFVYNCWMLRNYSLEFRVILFGDTNAFRQAECEIKNVIFESKKPCFWNRWILY